MQPRFLTAALFSVATLGLGACDSVTTSTRTISGTVTSRERMALPPAAEVEVKLVDVSLADAPAVTVAETRITPEGAVPIPYALEFDPAKIETGHEYALQARITAGGHLLFTTTTRQPAPVADGGQVDLLVQRAAP